MRVFRTWVALVAAVMVTAAIMLLVAGCGDGEEADRMVKEADELRVSAVNRFRKSTAAMDGLVKSAAAGQSLPVNQTQEATLTASQELSAALGDLTLRDARLSDAQALELNDSYREYLAMLKDSNDRMSRSIDLALQIPALLNQEQYTVAGWDEIKTEIVVSQIRKMQDDIQLSYQASEMVRNQAEQLKKDRAGDF